MRFRLSSVLAIVLIVLGLPNISNAAAVSGQGTWESTLQARDLDGNLATTEAFYDSTLNITWLADAALSKTESFGITGINLRGRMDWFEVADWISAMNTSGGGSGYLGQNSWRLPTILDDSSTAALLGQNSDSSRSELASLFYDTLGNLANTDENGVRRELGVGGLTNTAEFENLQAYYYATDTDYVGNPNNQAWSFAFHSGDQYNRGKTADLYSFAVLDGDVGAIIATPVPAAVWLFGSGLISLVGFAGRKKG